MLTSLLKRSGFYFTGLAFSKILTTLVFILSARYLGPSQFGQWILFYTLYSLIILIADVGLNQWYQKNASERDKTSLFHELISARILTLVISLIIGVIIVAATHSFSPFVSIMFLLILLPETIISIVDGFYLERKEPIKISVKTVFKALILLIVLVIYRERFTFEIAAVWWVFGSIITAIWLFPWKMLKNFQISSLSNIIATIKNSSAYAILITTSYAYARGDSLVIRYALGSSALGLYGSAYRYLESIALIPTALQHNLFPLSAKKGTITMHHLQKIIFAMSACGVIVSLILFFASGFLITDLLGPAYNAAILPLKIFSLVLLLFFINSPLATVVQSSDFVSKFLPWGIGNTIANIILNIIFIPIYGVAAAAWIMFLTELTGLLINMYFVKKIYT